MTDRRPLLRFRSIIAMVGVLMAITVAPAGAEDTVDPVNSVAPTVTGTARWGSTLLADPGVWEPAETPLVLQWLRGGAEIAGESGPSYVIDDTRDLSETISVRVHPAGRPDLAVVSAGTAPVVRATLENTRRPSISGTVKYRRTLTADSGSWSPGGPTLRYQWFSAGKSVTGATGQKYTVRPSDVGHTLRVEVTASRTGFTTATVSSAATSVVQHAVTARRTVTYSVRTRGTITQSLSTFKRQAQETLDDPRGWRANGIRFKQVSSGGNFTLVLSQASKVPTFSSACSSAWSCRVGRNVVINQTRWRSATPSWNKAGGSLRNYRTMVVNHEVGHWLGKGHATCSKRGSLAPVMQQQSKSLKGCRFNPWPKASELYSPRFGF